MDVRQVVRGLLGDDPELTHLYTTNANFKVGVDTLVMQFVPIFLRGLAEDARERGQKMEADFVKLMKGKLGRWRT